MMRALASFILRGYSQAMLVVVGTAVLALVLPPFSLLSGAALALASLRNGAQYGLTVMLGATAVVAGLAYFSLGNLLPALAFLGILWLPLWIVSWVLREFRSLALATIVTGGLGVLAVLAAYLLVGDISQWWQDQLMLIFEPAIQQGGALADRATVQGILAEISKMMTGIAAAGMVLNSILCLYLARGWQATLFNPGGFRSEFYELRLGRAVAIVALLVVLISLLPAAGLAQLADEVMIVLLALYVVQGLALIHAIVAKRKLHMAWLVGVYVVVFFVLPQLLALIAVLGLVDSWADFRKRVAEKAA